MSIDKSVKTNLIKTYARTANDTGSPEVQIAVLSEKIKSLTEHLKVHKKDESSKHGMIRFVGQRRRLLDYLKSINNKKYEEIIAKLGIRK